MLHTHFVFLKRINFFAFSSAVLLAGLFVAAFNPSIKVNTNAADDPDVSETSLQLSTSNIDMDLVIINPNGTFSASDSANIEVATNNFTGYTLSFAPSSDDENANKLVNGENAINSISAPSSENDFPINTWGVFSNKIDSLDNELYQPVSSEEYTVIETTDSANDEANIYSLSFGVKIDSELPAGKYSNTFAIEATANPVTYSIDYGANEGVVIVNAPEDEYGTSSVTKIYLSSQVPERTGYDYVSWCSGNVTTVSGVDSCDDTTYQPGDELHLSQIANNDIRLKSMWTPTKYTISYNLNGGSATNPTEYNIVTSDITLSNPTRNGYTFTGWTGSNGTTVQTIVTIPQGSVNDKSYTANWTPTNYTISYNLNGGSATNNTSYNIETNSFTLNNPTRTGYTFKGWSGTGLSGDTNKTVTIAKGSTGDKSYTANWTINTYTVTCEDWFVDASNNGKVKLGSSTKTYNYGATASGADWGTSGTAGAYYSGYVYKTATSGTVPAGNTLVVYRRFYAWTDLNIYYAGGTTQGGATVGFKVGNGSWTDVTNESNTVQPYGTTYYINNIRPKNSYEELGSVSNLTWNASGSYYYYTPTTGGTVMSISMKYKTYTITYTLNSGSVSGNPTSYTYATAAFTLKNPTRSGYTFTGWTGTGLSSASTSVTVPTHSTGNRSYTANWRANCTFTSKEFNYTGGVQEWTVPDGCGATYLLEVYGAKGGDGRTNDSDYTATARAGGKGGYAKGTVTLSAGTKLYIVVGGQGTSAATSGTTNGGYNGGGKSRGNNNVGPGSGGGATHIASVTGTLQAIGASNKSKVYIVAGGGGGSYPYGEDNGGTGGYGGGTTGGYGYYQHSSGSGNTGSVGTQTAAGSYAGFGYGAPALSISYGWDSGEGPGGGGGLYGGSSHGDKIGGACGGSGYIGGVSNGSMSNGVRSGNGYAKITKQ